MTMNIMSLSLFSIDFWLCRPGSTSKGGQLEVSFTDELGNSICWKTFFHHSITPIEFLEDVLRCINKPCGVTHVHVLAIAHATLFRSTEQLQLAAYTNLTFITHHW